MVREWIKGKAKEVLPERIQSWLRNQCLRFRGLPPVGGVWFGSLRRLTPISRSHGYDRGTSIARYYINQFIAANAADVKGHVLEIGWDLYTKTIGADRVTKGDVLSYVEAPKATIVADLTCATSAHQIPANTFDCIICTQTLEYIYDPKAAVSHLYRILKPGGVLLATFPGISRVDRHEGVDDWGTYWYFTEQSARRLFQTYFPAEDILIKAHGNVLAAIAFLHGLAAEELRQEELAILDPEYAISLAIRAVKPDNTPSTFINGCEKLK